MKGFDKIIGEFGLIVRGGECHAERGQIQRCFGVHRSGVSATNKLYRKEI